MSATKGAWTDMGNWKIPASVEITDGSGHKITDTRGLFVLHAALLHTGKVLIFCGHAEAAQYAGISYVWDPANPNVQMKPIPFPASMDLFCCHYVTVPDGRLLVLGGSVDFHKHGDASLGAKNVCFFKPDPKAGGTGTWSVAKKGSKNLELFQGRWYPTVILTGDAEVLVFSGRAGPGDVTNFANIADTLETISIPKPGATNVKMTIVGMMDSHGNSLPLFPTYPGMHLMNDLHIYYTSTTWGQEAPNPNTLTIDWTAGGVHGWKDTGFTPINPRREEGMSVVLPPAQKGNILLVGGSLAVNRHNVGIFNPDQLTGPTNVDTDANGVIIRGQPAFHHTFAAADHKAAETMDTRAPTLAWKAMPNLNEARTNGTCVVLPDSTVFIMGGHDNYKWHSSTDRNSPTHPSLPCELFDGTNFIPMASLNHPRMYHSIGLLLPDGSVLAAGGADPNEREPLLSYPQGWAGARYGEFLILNNPYEEIPLFLDRQTGYGYFVNTSGIPVLLVRVGNVLQQRTTDPRTGLPIQNDAGTGFPIISDPFPPHNNIIIDPVNGIPASIPLNRKDYEIYKPTYFFKTARPVITDVLKNGKTSRQMDYGQELVVKTPQGNSIAKAALMRLGCITHHTETEQRYLELTITSKTATTVNLKMPPDTDKHIATPGYYMLWIIDDKNMPCEKAEIVQLTFAPKAKTP